MKKLGIIAGIGPESTIQYYRSIISQYQEKLNTKDYPEITLHSINMTKMLNYVFQEDLDGLVAFLQARVQVLEKAGANLAVLASNTPHIVFDELAKKVNIPLISIVKETCKYVAGKGLKRVSLFGTQSTMSKGFYQKKAGLHGLEIIAPGKNQQAYIHDKYMNELVFDDINPETKKRLVSIAQGQIESDNIQGLILGGTELPLILKQEDFPNLQVFDTTQIHVQSIVKRMTED
ncbi:MAG: amino acid racemase [Roseivirga sp.]|nr:amino acid racemase [Roseivirga sp.]